jgi:flagellar hook-associated protein 3 FlgL
MDSAQQKLATAQEQETTGYAFNTARDNPGGTIQLLGMNSMQSQLNQYQSNLTTANNTLGLTDNALSSANTLMQNAYEVALQAANATNDSSSMQEYASQIDQIQQQLVALGNQQNANGEYLFAGQKTNTQPFSAANGQLTYSGDGNSISVPVGPSSSITVNVPGSPLFTNAYQTLETLKTDIQNGNASAISNTDVQNLQNSLTAITNTRGSVGASAQEVASLTTDNQRRIEELTSQISSLHDVDTATATTNYAQAQSAYQAALSVISQAGSLSLANFLSTSNA